MFAFWLIPFMIFALGIIVIGVPYGFISEIKDMRLKWSITGAYCSLLGSLWAVIDLRKWEQLWEEFSLSKTLMVITAVGLGTMFGWIIGTMRSPKT